MAGSLDGKVALVTGGCSGIGLASAMRFVEEGAKVVVADLQDDKGAALERSHPDAIRYVRCDVTCEADITTAVALCEERFGGLDVLFNNAGSGGALSRLERMDAAEWDATFAVLVRAPMLGMKHAVPAMKRRGGGSIINTASVAGQIAGQAALAYSTCKAAVIHLSKITAGELSPQGIRVNALCPGLVATPLLGVAVGLSVEDADVFVEDLSEAAARYQPIPRAGTPDDVAEAALFLASDASGFMTGTHMVVDGGLSIGPPSSWRRGSGSPLKDALYAYATRPEVIAAALSEEHIE